MRLEEPFEVRFLPVQEPKPQIRVKPSPGSHVRGLTPDARPHKLSRKNMRWNLQHVHGSTPLAIGWK